MTGGVPPLREPGILSFGRSKQIGYNLSGRLGVGQIGLAGSLSAEILLSVREMM